MYSLIIGVYIIVVIIHMSGDVVTWAGVSGSTQMVTQIKDHKNAIEFLTQYKTKDKNYDNGPESYNARGREGIVVKKKEDSYIFKYTFPLFKKHEHTLVYELKPNEVSEWVSKYGIPRKGYSEEKDRFSSTVDQSEEIQRKNQFILSNGNVSPDHKDIVEYQRAFTKPIADSIKKRLNDLGEPTYTNKIQAALHFVQYIPYGVPRFDTNNWRYGGLAVPPESFILGYSDCDSKSIFMASILMDLISRDQVILVGCKVSSGPSDAEGNHMMIAVSDLEKKPKSIYHKGRDFLLIETTAPNGLYHFGWHSFKLSEIIDL